jgi:hypothetical protein
MSRQLTRTVTPPRPCGLLRNHFALFRAQLLGAGVTALLPPKFAQGNGGRVLVAGRLWRRWFGQRLPRGLFHDGAGELADVGGLRFFA